MGTKYVVYPKKKIIIILTSLDTKVKLQQQRELRADFNSVRADGMWITLEPANQNI